MLIEIQAPACLPLAQVVLPGRAGKRPHLIGVALHYPAVDLAAQPAPKLAVSGARAPAAYGAAERYLQAHPDWQPVEIDIESAVPALMGLSSDAVLAVSVAHALAAANGHEVEPPQALAAALRLPATDALAVWACQAGGLLCIEPPATTSRQFPTLACRIALAHEPADEWVWVLYLPLPGAGTPEGLERERMTEFFARSDRRPADGTSLWAALEQDDPAAFGRALLGAQTVAPGGEEILAQMQGPATVAWGQSPGGMALYALVHGGPASIVVREALRERMGPFAGTVLGSDTANQGVLVTISDTDLNERRARE